ncbi:cytochrome b subunit of succinate dehydrogenase, Sdh3p [Vararia minispora EC-137]|uniref:Cytochrome b subunit of succinate dehydrogenase, Sdh3p n=1 Tax=Vararia minispora EC-137 TaxID=1314806 RepID=A0ACB8QCK6_9AGAM|nr:cytochrome b subunit of succinate dehydrogenase, Sdh3p [Vararia minispora EC-137]
MNVTRVGLGSVLRRATVAPRIQSNQLIFRRAAFKRTIKTQTFLPEAAGDILNAQRLKRPSSPHFTIYQPQLTWYASIAHRMTGTALSVLLYGFALAYLAAPGTFSSKKIVEQVKKLPTSVKMGAKVLLAAPFTFHSFNGIRHLLWDMKLFMNVKGCYQTGYAVLGASAVSTAALVMM